MAINNVKDFVNVLCSVENTDRDNFVAVTGSTGEGKSSFTGLAYIEYAKLRGRAYDFNEDCIFTKDELMKILKKSIPKNTFFWLDEAVNVMFNRTFHDRDQIRLLQIFDMMRDRNCTVFMCMPDFWSFDSHLLAGRFRFWVHIDRRGRAYVFEPSQNMFSRDRWSRVINEKNVEKGKLHRVKNLVGVIHFDKMEESLFTEYKRVKQEKRKRAIKNIKSVTDKDILRYLRIAKYTQAEFYFMLSRINVLKYGAKQEILTKIGTGFLSDLNNRYQSSDDGVINLIVRTVHDPETRNNRRYVNTLVKLANKGDDLQDI